MIGAGAAAALLLALLFVAIAFPAVERPAPAPVAKAAPSRAAAPRVAKASVVPVSAPVDQNFVVRRILDIPGPLRHGDYVWDDKGVPPGPIVITVDLAAQTLSVFRGGYEIGTAVILYGGDDKPTPLGVFPITQKDADHVSNIYHVPMPYMLRLTNDGVSIHGSKVEWNVGTSGCIGVPVAFAALLFAQAKLGDRVLITNGKMLGLGEPIVAS